MKCDNCGGDNLCVLCLNPDCEEKWKPVPEEPEDVLSDWLETTFRDAILDDERVMEAAAMLKVGVEHGHPATEVIRRCIAAFVRELIDPGAIDRETENRIRRN